MHSRRSSAGQQQQQQPPLLPQNPQHPQHHSHSHRSTRHASHHSSHHRSNTDPESPTLLRLPSSTSSGASLSPRSRRATNPSTPTLTTSQLSTSSATSPSYFSPQATVSAKEARSPGFRRPPASFSGHGIDNSRGPPVTLITRGNSDIARRSSQKPSDFAFAQQQLLQLGIVSPGGSRSARRRKDVADDSSEFAEQSQPNTPTLSRQPSSTTNSRHQTHMASSAAESSEYESGIQSHSEDTRAMHSSHGGLDPNEEHAEDLFLNIAEDTGPRKGSVDAGLRNDRLRSRITRSNNANRQSFPSALEPSISSASRIPASTNIKPGNQYRRSSHLPASSRNLREQSPLSPASAALETPRSRLPDLSPKPSFPSARKDSDLSPREFLARMGGRRPSLPDAAQTPPNRSATYRPSNLNYSSSRDNPRTPQAETPQEPQRGDGTESHGSTGPAASVWDELDDLKSRIRRIELGGKIPTTSGAAVAQASAERPRTANTSVTTMSSSPKQQRKDNTSPSESTIDTQITNRVHPLLKEALAKTRQHTSPTIYRVLEATAAEAMALAELTGSGGPQGTLHSASSILNGASLPDRHVRRKADNICRNLTELCIAMCDPKTAGLASPAVRSTAASVSRRPSVQISSDSPTIRQSVEPESYSGVSPSRALARIESRRTSMLATGINGGRETSQEPLTPSSSHIPRNFSRAGTSLHRTRRSDDVDDEDPTLRAPSRAMTDFREARSADKRRYSRQYTSREPMPDLQPSPALQTPTGLRRPTVTGIGNENQFYSENKRLYDMHRESSPAYDKRATGEFTPRTQYNPNRHSIIGVTGLSRSGSLNRRLRGTSAGE